MCGITGKIYFNQKSVSKNDIETMNSAIRHRGPDDGDIYISPDKQLGLGHRRLSIIDLSPLGHQPMNYLKRYWIVFNGEIYNFQEKKEKLIRDGYKFKSKSDTEVILALYHKFGVKCLEHLRGMFAFAIYDEKEKTLFCARDRVGKKPFKYYLDDNVFIFASELKAILTQTEYKKEPDYEAIYHYLTLQYVPAPMTGFKGIEKLEPGHFLFLNLKTKEFVKKRYWKLDYREKLDLPENEWKKRILEKLEESVRLRMIADVPLGAFLSGGTDSSAVVGLMSRLSEKKIKTFTIGFNEQKYDESGYAKVVAKKFKTDHTEFRVKPEAVEILPYLVKQYEEPYADSSALPTFYLSRETRKNVTVALNGDGGDENFAGYERYVVQKIGLFYERFKLLNDLLTKPISKITYDIFPNVFTERLKRFALSMDMDYRKRFMSYSAYFTEDQKEKMYLNKPNINTYDFMCKFFDDSKSKNRLENTLYSDFASYLPECLLAKVDIATMSVSLEGRSPFLDHEFLEMTAKIPINLKINKFGETKYILKKALEGLVPDEVMYRPKRGFSLPIQEWFKSDLGKYVEKMLISDSSMVCNFLKKDFIKNMIKEHRNGNVNYGNKLWSLLTLELWFKEYFL